MYFIWNAEWSKFQTEVNYSIAANKIIPDR